MRKTTLPLLLLIFVFAACETATTTSSVTATDAVADTATVSDTVTVTDSATVTDSVSDSVSVTDSVSDSVTAPDAATAPDAGPDTAAPRTEVNYVIVALDDLTEAAATLADYRNERGFVSELHSVSSLAGEQPSAETLLAAVRTLVSERLARLDAGDTLHLVLVGDAPALPAIACTNPYGDCATDNAYGDVDGDRLPEAAVGRIPVGDAAAFEAYLAKLRAFEATYEPGTANRRVGFFAGEPGFGEPIDSTLEDFIFRALRETSHHFDILGAYAVPTSSYFYEPFAELVRSLFNDGTLLVVYEGHGSTQDVQGLGVDDLSLLDCPATTPHAFLYACSAGDYTGATTSLGEALVLSAGGPVAALASVDVSHPYANTILPYETMRAFLNERPQTVGAGLLGLKRAVLTNADDTRAQIDAAATLLSIGADEQEELKRVHLDLYNLFGDPGAAVRYPNSEIVFDEVTGSVAERGIVVSGRAPGLATGTAHVTVETERDVVRGPLESWDPDNPVPEVVQRNWARAVDKRVAEAEVSVTDGAFTAELTFPDELPSCDYWIKVYADDGERDAFGSVSAP